MYVLLFLTPSCEIGNQRLLLSVLRDWQLLIQVNYRKVGVGKWHSFTTLWYMYIQLSLSPPPPSPPIPPSPHTDNIHTLTLACAMDRVREALADAASLSSVAWFMMSCTSLSILSVSTAASCANCSCSAFSLRMMLLRNCCPTSEGMRT